MAYVEATEALGRSRWKGTGRGLSYRVCQAIKQVLAGSAVRDWWSQRAQSRVPEIRAEFAWLDADTTVVLAGPDGGIQWWTFGGAGANASLSQAVSARLGIEVPVNRVAIEMQPGDRAVVLRLKGRLPEGTVLTAEQMRDFPFELALLTRLADPIA